MPQESQNHSVIPQLEPDEARLLSRSALLSQLVILIAGVILCILSALVRFGDISVALRGGGWIAELAATMTPNIWVVIIPIIFAVCMRIADPILNKFSQQYRDLKQHERDGLTGELILLPSGFVYSLMIVAGFVEEFTFRFAAIALIGSILELVLPGSVALSCAVLIAAFVFWVFHAQYRVPIGFAVVFVMGVVLGTFYLGTGCLLGVAIAHALHDILDVLFERRLMRKDPKAFYSDTCTHRILLDMVDQEEL